MGTLMNVARLALQVTDKGVNPFVGTRRLDESVVHSRAQQLSPGAADKCREEMLEESKLDAWTARWSR